MNTYTNQRTDLTKEYDYIKLDEMTTAEFTMNIMRLMDRVFETPNKDFENYANTNYNLVEDDPAELFDRCFKSIENFTFTKYQEQFKNFAEVNTTTIYKWFRKNGAKVNVSPKQVEWFKRWFVKHNIGHEFLNQLNPDYNRSIKPNFGPIKNNAYNNLFGDK